MKTDKKRSEQRIEDVERVRNLKARQMARRLESIQEEMTKLWQGAKKEGMEERCMLTKKYEQQLVIVTDSIERLKSVLANARQKAVHLQQLVDEG